jgi:ABC-type transport system involved in multi-copper enzyme maturation permease subunit
MLSVVLQASISNLWFELQRSFSGQRLAIALVLAMFPPFIMFMVFRTVGSEGYGLAELLMAVMLWIVGLLSLILWLPPGIYSELEGQTWILSTSRPYGRVSLVLGKYGAAAIWTLLVLVASYAATWAICLAFFDLREFAWGFLQISILAAMGYGAVFSLLSVVALKRAMGFAVGYVLVSEVLLASVPALIQKFTVRYHLQSIGLATISDFGLDRLEDEQFVNNVIMHEPLPLWGNYLCLMFGSVAILSLTLAIVNWRQLITVNEN